MICSSNNNRSSLSEEGDEPMVLLRCPCQEKHKIWGELWWVGGGHDWVFFDDLQTSETHAEQITHCPGCGRQLERKNLTPEN
jgi:hypothetical protein